MPLAKPRALPWDLNAACVNMRQGANMLPQAARKHGTWEARRTRQTHRPRPAYESQDRMEHAAKLFLGAMLGALVGLLLGSRVRSCSTDGCRTRGPVWYYIIAMAFCGAAVAHYATR